MKIMVGYNGGEVGVRALELARDYALLCNAEVYIVTSMEGGPKEKMADVQKAEADLKFAEKLMKEARLPCTAEQSVRGFTPGEDLVELAREKNVSHIFLGIKKKSRAQKIIMGSTARYVILKAHCPVTTIN
ncbi:Nucleotide-binding universal stress protein, UspA family [Desulfocicer vacuolatum DSM 3385]|uniref:Nucleotide-binding universal stress protein, UspA family n=1 Tax=Desulfocicer vacuolatum DSM 3385 TaxID=1121400 RepID=A0A1W2E318_9BACT|nr:universal stress protein [Desulfocicer vacuolatum]SMD04109.1 Nucleotide-binding universal stress protein, UspA family [Desulfocicer vacuolatum DSM 3385]